MALNGIYIDSDGKAHASPDGKAGIPHAFAGELAKYKICLLKVNDLDNAQKADKAIDETSKKWEEIDKAQKAALAAEIAAAEKEAKDAKEAAEKTEKDELAAEDALNKNNLDQINNNPNLNPAQKTTAIKAENTRHIAARGKIIKKKNDALTAATNKKNDRIKKFKDEQTKPTEISFACVDDPKKCGDVKCKLNSMGQIEVNNKPKIGVNPSAITNIAQLSKDHVYFCTCGKK